MSYKNLLFIGAALLFTGALSADESSDSCMPKACPTPCPPPRACPPKPCCMPQKKPDLKPAYNGSALDGNNCSYGFHFSGSFIYWQAQQGGMDIALGPTVPIVNPLGPPPDFLVLSAQNASYQFQDVSYKPGFKVGLGWNGPYEWAWNFEYTRFHSSTTTNLGNPPSDPRGASAWSLSTWYGVFYPFTASSINSVWHVNLDMIDGVLAYPYYQGKMLTVTPYAGLRTFWLHQNMKVTSQLQGATVQPCVSHNQSHGWDIGPVAGMKGNWLIGEGFRFEADVEGSLLYNHFNVKHRDNADLPFTGATPFSLTTGGTSVSYKQNTVRPMASMGLGLGWGWGEEYHFDLLAKYDFMILWSQNAMRTLMNAYAQAMGDNSSGDLTLQGLTITAMFDF